MALDWQNYLNANPDVMQEYAKSSTFQLDPGNASGRFINPVSEEAFAKAHYDQFGKNEGRVWGAAPNTGGTTGTTGTTGSGTTTGTMAGGINLFQPDLYSKSYSGIGSVYQKELMDSILPQLKASFQNYGANIDKSTKAAQEGFTSMNKRAMTSGLQDILNNLSNRGMLNSSVASDAISKGMTDLTSANSDKAFQAAMQNAILKAEEPQLLARIASLGNYSESSDPGQPYDRIANFFKATM